AYLHYRYLEDPSWLKTKYQQVSSTSVSTTGPVSKINVPLGSHVTIVAHSDRKLKKVRVGEPDFNKREDKNSITIPANVVPTDAATVEERVVFQSFKVNFPDVTQKIEFDLDMTDENDVKGTRRILILPDRDTAPKVRELGLAVPARELALTGQGGTK